MVLLQTTAAAVLAAFTLLPVFAGGQSSSSYNLLNLEVVAGDGGGFTSTWTVPAGAWARMQKFSMYFTFFSSNNFRRNLIIYPDDARLNRTGDMYSFQFAGLFSLDSYVEYNSNSYGGGDDSFLITVVGYDGAGYWFSNDAMFTPVKSNAPFELLVLWMSDDFSTFFAKNLAEELTLAIRSASSGFVRSRGSITGYQLVGFEGYSVFRGSIRVWGNAAMMYRGTLQQWLNDGIVNGTSIGESLQGKLLYFFSTRSIPVLLSEGPCGFVIDSTDDPFCPSNTSVLTMTEATSSPTSMATMASTDPTSAMNNMTAATEPSTQGSTGGLQAIRSNNTISYIALVVSGLAILISLFVSVSIALYSGLLNRRYTAWINEKKSRPFSEMSFVESPSLGAVSPFFDEGGKELVIHDDDDFEPDYDGDNFQKVDEEEDSEEI